MSEQSTVADANQSDRLVVQVVMKTDVGLVRSENQDFGSYTTPQEEAGSKPGGRLLVVADGMGGHRGGATASRLATETVKAQYLGSDTDDIATALRDALLRANARVFTEAQSNMELRGMGTTTSALVVHGNNAWFGHIGDSRIYLVRNGEIRQLTDDHSLVATMVREGLLTAEEAETHPRRNVLQRSLGVGEEVEADVRGPLPVQEGDVFILCSDGLHGLVKSEEMKEVAKMPIDKAATEFVSRALERGAPDNVTVIVARIVREGEENISTATVEVQPETEPGDDTLDENPAFDETQKVTAPLPAIRPPAPQTATPPPPAVAPKQPLQKPKAAEEVHTSSPFLKWSLIVVLVLGAAGAWIAWTVR